MKTMVKFYQLNDKFCVKEEESKPLKTQMDITVCVRGHRINKRRHIHINITYISTLFFHNNLHSAIPHQI
jgi:hypothetical protein